MSSPPDLSAHLAPAAELSSGAISEVTQPAGDDPEAPTGPLVPDISEPADPVVPGEPATPIDPTPEREVPEPTPPEVAPQPDPPSD